MFPSLNESIGWGRGIEAIPVGSKILLGDSEPLDTLPFIFTFMNHWLKAAAIPQSTNTQTISPATSIIFISFKTAQNRITSVFRKIFGIQLNLLAAQSRFTFIDALDCHVNSDQIIKDLQEALKKNVNSRTLIILEGFAWSLVSGLGSLEEFTDLFTKIQSITTSANLLIQWSRDLEADYPCRSQSLLEDIRLGGAGWLYLLSESHFIFCARPLKSGMSRDANGEIVAALGPQMQTVDSPKPNFYPIITLFKIPTDTTIQSFTKGNL